MSSIFKNVENVEAIFILYLYYAAISTSTHRLVTFWFTSDHATVDGVLVAIVKFCPVKSTGVFSFVVTEFIDVLIVDKPPTLTDTSMTASSSPKMPL